MPPARALAMLLLLAPAGVGCAVLRTAHLVCIREPELFCEPKDDRASLATYRALADEAWATHSAECPDECLPGDYAWGFREGFAQYVYAGGTGEPPATPPRPYWQLDLRSPEGAAAVRSWFEGYRLGARIAREGGYRKTATLTLSASLADCDACGCPDRAAADRPVTDSATTFQPRHTRPAPELIVPLEPVFDAETIELPQPIPEANGRSGRLPLPRAVPTEATPPDFEARAISATGETAGPQNAIFQIVR